MMDNRLFQLKDGYKGEFKLEPEFSFIGLWSLVSYRLDYILPRQSLDLRIQISILSTKFYFPLLPILF